MLRGITRAASAVASAASLSILIPLGAQALVSQGPGGTPFVLQDATVQSINAAFDAGTLTSEKLIELYLARIREYENRGPRINAFINIHPDPLSLARALDEERKNAWPAQSLARHTGGPQGQLQHLRSSHDGRLAPYEGCVSGARGVRRRATSRGWSNHTWQDEPDRDGLFRARLLARRPYLQPLGSHADARRIQQRHRCSARGGFCSARNG